MASIKYVLWALVTLTVFAIMFFFAVAVMDPFVAAVEGYPMGGMGDSVDGIHTAIVQYMVPVFIGSTIIVTVLYILREERQTVR